MAFGVSVASVAWSQSPTEFWNSEWRRGRATTTGNDSRSRDNQWDRWQDRDSQESPSPAAPRRKETTASQSDGGAYCVRTCDGFYFPLTSAQQSNAPALCQSLCPAAKTDVYYRRGDSMEDARTRAGKSYASLPEAFAYRKQLKPDCTCQSASTSPMSVADDPTLRSGDLVVTEAGAVVFRGSSQLPHKQGDFVDYRIAREVAGSVRSQLAAMIRRYYTAHAEAPNALAKAKQSESLSLRSNRRRKE
jgi:hypothetical protein